MKEIFSTIFRFLWLFIVPAIIIGLIALYLNQPDPMDEHIHHMVQVDRYVSEYGTTYDKYECVSENCNYSINYIDKEKKK